MHGLALFLDIMHSFEFTPILKRKKFCLGVLSVEIGALDGNYHLSQ